MKTLVTGFDPRLSAHTLCGLRQTWTDSFYRLNDSILVHSDSVKLTHGIQAASRDPTSNGSCKMTSKAVDYKAYHFGVADEGVSALH